MMVSMSAQKTAWYKRKWVWIVTGVVILAAVIGLIFGEPDDEDEPAAEPTHVAAETPEPDDTTAPAAKSPEERAARLEAGIKTSLGVAPDGNFSDLYAQDPTLWGGYINGVRVEGSNAYITLQVAPDETQRDGLGERAAQALSTLLTEDMVDGIDWLIIEDAAGVVIDQKQPAPIM